MYTILREYMSKFNIEQTKFLVTGGSGSLGRNIIKLLLEMGASQIISISRDENLLKDAEAEIRSKVVQFKLGDISDSNAIPRLIKDIDVVFHTAALKHVSLAEQNPREFHKVNVTALLNLLDNSMNVKCFVHISSDKAIGVINCYGATKLLGEYLVRETNKIYNGNKYIIVRCPNFLGSRGSVLDVWKVQLAKENKIKVTDLDMTRYFITLSDAAKFIVQIALQKNPNTNTIYYPLRYTKKFSLRDLAEAFVEVFGNKDSRIEEIGFMPGEKKHEDYIKDVKLTPKSELKKLLRKLML